MIKCMNILKFQSFTKKDQNFYYNDLTRNLILYIKLSSYYLPYNINLLVLLQIKREKSLYLLL